MAEMTITCFPLQRNAVGGVPHADLQILLLGQVAESVFPPQGLEEAPDVLSGHRTIKASSRILSE